MALYIKTLSDNSNRTATNIRSLLNKSGGTMAEMGAVSRQFKEIGEIIIEGCIVLEKVKGNEKETIVPFDTPTLENQLL
ncbi:YebC/PmpR family DNA-binding transcriptional regulator [Patescibacteria group bacterium]|nr:YebC/PmpR family DNA-binding transcriptional regulator [Patescibacteria group bacterium]